MAGLMDIREGLDAIARGAWAEWRGLGGEWSRKALVAEGKELRACRAYELSGAPVTRCELTLPGQPRPLHCFFNQDGAVVLLRLEDPKQADAWPALQAKLGQPDRQIPLPPEHAYAPSTQVLYPWKGITFYIVELPDKAKSVFTTVSLYAPASADHYLLTLGGQESVEYFDDP